jgi:DNA-directed RNA polymerase alpha subunit/DNA-directed RNA polymerase subunit L
MNPSISNVSEDGDVYQFTLANINVSLANGLRRIILSEIPTYAFITETYQDNKCTIHTNTSRLHNEIIKQRLSCIPIHETDMDILTDKYVLELDKTNDTDNVIYATTEDFKIRNKSNGNYLTKEETKRIFPANSRTGYYIDFVRLKPKISDTIPGEQIKLEAEFSVSNARQNSMYNVVSKCTYANTPDLTKVEERWDELQSKLVSEESTRDEIEFQKRNFYMLDAQRFFKPDSFDFTIQTVGVYDNKTIVKKGCLVLQNKFVDIIEAIDSDVVPIFRSETTMDNCYDIILENEDYTMGKILEYLLYTSYYEGDKSLTYCGFKKFHPHNPDSTIRVAFSGAADKNTVRQYLRDAANQAQEFYSKLHRMF